MEKVLRKSALYGLLLGLAFAILFVNYKNEEYLGNGVTEISYKPVIEYIVSLLRIGVIGMLLGLILGLIISGLVNGKKIKTKATK